MSFDYSLIIAQFRNAMEARGIAPPADIIADGEIHRCDAQGRKSKRGAAYKLHLDGVPAGGFDNWHDGRGWENWKADVKDSRTPEEKARFAQEMQERRLRRAEKARICQAQAKSRAEWIWDHREEAVPDHPYLLRKQIPPVGLGLYKGALLLPMRDINGELHSLQFIKEDGSKTYLKHGLVEGCFFGLGEPGDTIYEVEGYATAASVHLATGCGVAVAFDSGNLLPVARALRKKYPAKRIVICSDDDVLNVLRRPVLQNAGLMAAYHAAREVNALVAMPVFPHAEPMWPPGQKLRASAFRGVAAMATLDPAGREYRQGVIPFIDGYVTRQPELAGKKSLVWGDVVLHLRDAKMLEDETDFNDLHVRAGLRAVKECIERAVTPPAAAVQALEFDIAI